MRNQSRVTSALVTGANKGLGFEISRQLGHKGISVIMASRDRQRGENAVTQLRKEGIDVHFALLDVTRTESIAALAQFVEERFGQLDILVNNAGAALDWTPTPTQPSQVSPEIAHQTFDINFFGPLAVTQVFLPLLRQSPAGRIVNVSSFLGSLAEMSNPDTSRAGMIMPMYRASKAALNALTLLFAKELRNTLIKINAANPGWVDTDGGIPSWMRAAMGGKGDALSVEEGADTPVWLATLPDDGPTGGFFDSRAPIPVRTMWSLL